MDKIRCGVIGAGYFGKHYVRLLQEMPGVELRMVAAASSETLAALKLPSHVVRTQRWEDTIEDKHIDAVVVATPMSWHFPMAKAALEAGKHVLLEKPMARSVAEAYELKNLVLKHERVFLVGHQYLYNDHVIFLQKELEKGTLGAVRYVFAEHFYPGPVRDDVGCFWETATHQLAIIDYLFRPEKILHAVGRAVEFRGNGREDFASADILFSGNINVSLVMSWAWPEKIRRFMVAGSGGGALFDDQAEEVKLKFFDSAGSATVPHVAACEPLRNQLEHFFRCIQEKEAPRAGIEHGIRVTEMLDTISRAIKK